MNKVKIFVPTVLILGLAAAGGAYFFYSTNANSSFLNLSDWKLDYGKFEASPTKVDAFPATDGQTSYYLAPQALYGDWRGKKFVAFELKSWGGSYFPSNSALQYDDIILKNGNKTATFYLGNTHDSGFHYHRVLFENESWTLEGGAKSIEEILSNVTEFRIRAEYGSDDDFSILRNVKIAQ